MDRMANRSSIDASRLSGKSEPSEKAEPSERAHEAGDGSGERSTR
jgi:hypothetical protein